MSIPLAAITPPVTPELLAALAALNVRNTYDLIFTPAPTLLRQLPSGTITLGQLKSLIARATAISAAPGVTAEVLYATESVKYVEDKQVRSGVRALDALLGGSFGGPGCGRVVEVSGDAGGGKTALALHIVLHHLAAHETAAALWMDTTGDLSPARLTSVLPFHASGAAATGVLERLHISQAFDLDAAQEVIRHLRTALATTPDMSPRPRILVIDTVTPLIGPQLSAISSQGVSHYTPIAFCIPTNQLGHAAMTTFMRLLGNTARTFGLAILVLNNSTALKPPGPNPASCFAATTRKPALGPSFAFLTDATLWLAHAPPGFSAETEAAGEVRVAEMFRSRVSVSRTWCPFRLRDGAILEL
ncbi:P-loop containing nucleoside triphosphate hydrolase protein [Auriscalpium vulgare]|uniref:P-loop containing nucleoside triphosphate hydrolase protein n=1 Tax=Auriscalpium vulgare TaxID=40419 RepID=A0ACB8RRC0_9AGAM|nr:P-loop containing nucleoside triphosphate hydrolase protein [Auriscalpium vulgare]